MGGGGGLRAVEWGGLFFSPLGDEDEDEFDSFGGVVLRRLERLLHTKLLKCN